MFSMGREIADSEKFEEKFYSSIESRKENPLYKEKKRESSLSVSKVNAVEAVESTFIGCKFTGAITGRYNAGY